MPFLEDVGRSNIGQTLGGYLGYLKDERRQALEQRRMGLYEKQVGAQIATSEAQKNLASEKLAQAKQLRQKFHIDQFRQQIPFGFDYLFRSAKSMFLVDKDGFVTGAGLQKFGEWMREPENNLAFGKAALSDINSQLEKINSIEGSENEAETLKSMNITKKDIPKIRAKLQQARNHYATVTGEFEDNLKIWKTLSEDFRDYLKTKGVGPSMSREEMNTGIETFGPEHQRIKAEAELKEKQAESDIVKQRQIDVAQVKAGLEKPDDFAKNLYVIAQEAGISPDIVKKGKLTRDQARDMMEIYVKRFGAKSFLQMLLTMGAPTMKFDKKGNLIKK